MRISMPRAFFLPWRVTCYFCLQTCKIFSWYIMFEKFTRIYLGMGFPNPPQSCLERRSPFSVQTQDFLITGEFCMSFSLMPPFQLFPFHFFLNYYYWHIEALDLLLIIFSHGCHLFIMVLIIFYILFEAISCICSYSLLI